MQDHIEPQLIFDAFYCPHCGAFSHQRRGDLEYYFSDDIASKLGRPSHISLPKFKVTICQRCDNPCIWKEEAIIFPSSSTAPRPHQEMPAKPKQLYEEARTIHTASPKGSAALLRFALQVLCMELGGKGEKINDDIAELVKKGLPATVQQALDVVRVVGNNAVHPGQIDLDDSPEIAGSLFGLINFIVEKMIAEPKKIGELFNGLPSSAKAGIAKRDGGTP